MISKKEFNEKIADIIGDLLLNILHDDSAEYVDETQITNEVCRKFQVTEWEQRFFFSRVVNEIVTARPAMWHIIDRKNRQEKSLNDGDNDVRTHFLAGKGFGTVVLSLTMLASIFSGYTVRTNLLILKP